ncbi:ABC transporter permease [Dactylosporangium sp. NPDC051484]|uniref:ABC transporter permease n=1 Tax=Dactylosporangium sp. NPDC051484 TaxID=3154942 RepID=UPI00344B94E8
MRIVNEYLPFIVVGLGAGSAYAIAAMGLVLTYKTTGVFNLAQGAMGMVGAFAYYSLHIVHNVPTVLAVAICLLVVAPLQGYLLDKLVFSQIRHLGSAVQIVATLGLGTALGGLAVLIYGGDTIMVPAFLPTSTFTVAGVNIAWFEAITVLFAIAAAIGLRVFYSSTRFGLRARALVDNEELTRLEGVRTARIRSVTWMIGSCFATSSGLLLVPLVGLDSTILSLLVVQAFGAAAVGRLTSLPLTYVGAIAIGIAASITTKFSATNPAISGLAVSLPFIVLFLVAVLSPRSSTIGSSRSANERVNVARVGPWTRRSTISAVVLVSVLVLLPFVTSGVYLVGASGTVIFVLIFASLYMLVGPIRQVSLGHATFVALGALFLTQLNRAGVPYFLALLLAALMVVPIAAALSFPTVRLSRLYLALATLGFGLIAQYVFYPSSLGFGSDLAISVPRPPGLSGDREFYLVAVAIVLVMLLVIRLIVGGRLGRLSHALADSDVAVQSFGVNPATVRSIMFCLSAFFAAIAGGLLGSLYRSASTVQFGYPESLVLVAVLVSAGTATLTGSWLAAFMFIGIPVVFDYHWVIAWQPVLFGITAIINSRDPNGIVGMTKHQVLWVARQVRRLTGKSKEPLKDPQLEMSL